MEADVGNNKTNSSEQKMKSLPLAMLAVEHGSKTRLLFDLSSRKIHGVSSSVFPDATCAFENGGWLLMTIQVNSQGQQNVFLVHPSSGRQLHLPPVLCARDRGVFVFYVNAHGTPLVVARIEICSLVPTAHIACPGDGYWSTYTHDVDLRGSSRIPPEPICIVDVALAGTQAVCLSGEILMFDVTEMTWRKRRMGRRTAAPAGPTGIRRDDVCFLVAAGSGGEVVLVSHSSHTAAVDGASFKFFKLDMEALEWSPLDDRELDGTSWFLCKGQSFRAKEAGKRKVYTFCRPKHCIGSSVESHTETWSCFSSTFRHEISKSITNIYAYDLDDGTVDMVIPASVVTEVRHWVQPSIFAAPAK